MSSPIACVFLDFFNPLMYAMPTSFPFMWKLIFENSDEFLTNRSFHFGFGITLKNGMSQYLLSLQLSKLNF